MDTGLQGAKVIITGATRGIGRAIAEAFIAEGAVIGFCARQAAEVQSTAVALKAEGRVVDVADKAALAHFVAEMGQELGGVDVLVCNASGFADGTDEAAFRTAFEVDMLHTVAACDAAMPFLERSAYGSIIAISSISASEDYRHGDVAYGAMKAAINFYIKSLSGHLAPKAIRANGVSPGTTYFEGGFWHQVEVNQPESFASALAHNPMGRMAHPQEIADACVFLASRQASFITGINLVVDGGYTKRVQN